MKNINWKNIIIPVMAALIIFAVAAIANLDNEIDWLNNRINNLTSELNLVRNDMASIYSNVEEQLQKQASLLTSAELSLGVLDSEKHNADVEIKVVPKTFTENMEVSVKIGDTVTILNRNGAEFSANIPLYIFAEYTEFPMLYIESNGNVQTEVLENIDVTELYAKYLPTLYAQIPSNADLTRGKLNINSYLNVSAKPTEYSGNITFLKYEIITEVNGKEISREDITSEMDGNSYRDSFYKSVDAKNGDNVAIYAVAEDSLGFTHRKLAFYWYETEDGRMAELGFNKETIEKDGVQLAYR